MSEIENGETTEEVVEEVTDEQVEQDEAPTEIRDILEKAASELEDDEEQKEPEEEPEKEEEKEEPEKQEKQPEEEKPERNRWSAWKKEAQEELSKLPPNVQDMISAREEQFHKGISQYKEAANYAKTINRVLAPHREYLQSINVSEEVAIPTLIAAERSLRVGSPAQKIQSFLKLAHDYGVDVNELAQVPFNPELHALEKELNAANQKLSSHEYSQQEQMAEQADSVIAEFAQSHEHFDKVRFQMGELMDLAAQRNEPMTMEQAYEKAVRLDDSLFETVLSQRQNEDKKNQLLKATQAAKAAKGSAVQVKGSPTTGGRTYSTPPKTTEEAVRRAMQDMGMA